MDAPIASVGNVFSQATTPLGTAIPIYTATDLSDVIILFNPPRSGVDVEILDISINYVSGTAAHAAVGLMCRALDSIATGAAMTALADTTPKNGRFGKGKSSQIRSTNAGTNTVTAGAASDWWRSLFSINLEASAATPRGTTDTEDEPLGNLLIPPGNFVYLAATVASVALYASHFVWREWNSATWN